MIPLVENFILQERVFHEHFIRALSGSIADGRRIVHKAIVADTHLPLSRLLIRRQLISVW